MPAIEEAARRVRARIAAAAERAKRDPAAVRLVAVSKGHPVEAIREALAAGLEDFGENRAQELAAKAAAFEAAPPVWHFIGHLQRNKVHAVLPRIGVLHSVDSGRLIEEIARQRSAPGAGAADPLPCYLEVNVAGETQKSGVTVDQLPGLLAAAAASPALRVEGLMTVAPRVSDPELVRPVFRDLRRLAEAHGLSGLSMGMTSDFEVAIEEGATLVRIGTALFGSRPSLEQA